MVEMETQQNNSKVEYESVRKFVYNGLQTKDFDVQSTVDQFVGNDEIVKAAFDNTFRLYLVEHMSAMTTDDIKQLLGLAVLAAQKKLCSVTTPIFIVNDLLSSLTIEKCSEVFCYLEDSAHIWKSEMFYTSVRNYLLRMCNDLLKRLSKTQNTVFSGRIHLFLAKLFPLNEKSGLNLMSHFSDNFTRFTTSAEAFEEAINKNKFESLMDTDLNTTQEIKLANHSMPIDYNLYTHFWSLQEFFSKPNTCFDKQSWKTFLKNSNEVLEALKSYRLDDVKDNYNNNNQLKVDDSEDGISYFSKYLTSEKLLDLQLNDSNFRRQILIQFLILFQYLNAEVKFKTNVQVLNEEQNTWCKSAIKKVYELLKETPPSGSKFTHNVKHILEREEIWNKWKNEGCPNYVKEKPAPKKTPVKRLKPVTSDFVAKFGKNFISDTQSDIVKLCNINHNNLEACKDAKREFLPSLKEFFDEAIEQLDPENQVEKQYYLSRQTDWAWKALRLLAKRSSFYFMQNQNVKTISEYLEAICVKLSKEFTSETQKKKALEQQQIKELTEKEKQQETTESETTESPQTPSSDNNPENEENEDLVGLDDEQNQNVNSSIIANQNQNSQPADDQGDDQQEPMNTSAKNEFENVQSPLKPASDFDMADSPAPVQQMQDETPLLDAEAISLISENIGNAQDWKNIAVYLKMDEDTISFIESETEDIKEQCTKILRLWKEREEKKAFLSIVSKGLHSLELSALAERFDARMNEMNTQ